MGSQSTYLQEGEKPISFLLNEITKGGRYTVLAHAVGPGTSDLARNGWGAERVLWCALRDERGDIYNPPGFAFALGMLYATKYTKTGWGESDRQVWWKWVDEFCGPTEINCPAKVFTKLSPLPDDDHQGTQWAREWRERNRRWLERPALQAGDRVRFAMALQFTDEYVGQEFTYIEKDTFRGENWRRYRINNWQTSEWERVNGS